MTPIMKSIYLLRFIFLSTAFVTFSLPMSVAETIDTDSTASSGSLDASELTFDITYTESSTHSKSDSFWVTSGATITNEYAGTVSHVRVGDYDDSKVKEYLVNSSDSTITHLELYGDGVATNYGTLGTVLMDSNSYLSNAGIITGTLTTNYAIVHNTGTMAAVSITGSVVMNSASATMGDITFTAGGTLSNYGTVGDVDLNAGYMIHYAGATVGKVQVGLKGTSSSNPDGLDYNSVFVNYGSLSYGTANGTYSIEHLSGTVLNYGTVDKVFVDGGDFYNIISKQESKVLYDAAGNPVYETDADGNQVLQYETYDRTDGSFSAGRVDSITIDSGNLYNIGGASIGELVVNGGSIQNSSKHDGLTDENSGTASSITSVTMNGGYLLNTGISDGEKLSSYIVTLNIYASTAKVDNHGTVGTIKMTAGSLASNGTVTNLNITGGSIILNSGSMIQNLTATGTLTDGVNSITSFTNNYGSYAQNVTLEQLTLNNYGTLGLWWDNSGTENPKHEEGSLTLNNGVVLNNKTGKDEEGNATVGVLLETLVNTGAVLNNEGIIGYYYCGHKETFTAKLTIDGGTVNNLAGGYIYDALVSNGGLLTNAAGADKIVAVQLAEKGTLENAGLVEKLTIKAENDGGIAGTATNKSGGLIENAFIADGGILTNEQGGKVESVTVYESGSFINEGSASTVMAGFWNDDAALVGGYVKNTSTGTITNLHVINGGDVDNYGQIDSVVTLVSYLGDYHLSIINNYGTILSANMQVNSTLNNEKTVGTLTVKGEYWALNQTKVNNQETGTIACLDATEASITNEGTIGEIVDAEEKLGDTIDATLKGSVLVNSGAIGTVQLSQYVGLTSENESYTTHSTLSNQSGATIDAAIIDAGSSLSNAGTIKFKTDIAGVVINTGELEGTTSVNGVSAMLDNQSEGRVNSLVLTQGYVHNASGASIGNATVSGGTLNNEGSITGNTTVTGGTVNNSGSLAETVWVSGGTLNNNLGGSIAGTLKVTGGLVVGNGGTVDSVLLAGGEYRHDASVDEAGKALRIESLTLEDGAFNITDGNSLSIGCITTTDEAEGNYTTLTVGSKAESADGIATMDETLHSSTAELTIETSSSVDVLVNDGSVIAKQNLTINNNIQGGGTTTVAGKLTIKNESITGSNGADVYVAGSAGSITAGSLEMQSGSLALSDVLTLTDMNTANSASNLSASTVDMKISSTLTVANSFSASSVVIQADSSASKSYAGLSIITTDSLGEGEGGMSFFLTTDALEQFNLNVFERVHLLNLSGENFYAGNVDEFTLLIQNGDDTITMLDEQTLIWGDKTYQFDVVTNGAGYITSVDIYVKAPEPSTTALSLVALTALLARRRRGKA